MNRWFYAAIMCIFLFGWICGSVYSTATSPDISTIELPEEGQNAFFANQDLPSPSDWINERNIHVYKDKVVIDINNPQWAAFYPTKSMDPVFDQGANAIQIVPKKPEVINVGDIISYESKNAEGTVIHRVIRIGYDENGWYAITRGDNNDLDDPGKVRFSQVKKVLVAIIY